VNSRGVENSVMRRGNLAAARIRFLFRDTMLKLIHSDNLEYKELTKAIAA